MEFIHAPKACASVGPYSHCVKAGSTYYLCGQVPFHPVTGEVVGNGMKEQAVQTLANMKAVLEAAGRMYSLCESLAEHRNFLRIHRSYLVNLEHIQTITPKTLIMSSRAELPIPRGRYNDIKDAYLEHAFQKEQVFLT